MRHANDNDYDQSAAQQRLELIASILLLPENAVPDIDDDPDEIIDFALRHGQSIDWIVFGDASGMIAKLGAGRT